MGGTNTNRMDAAIRCSEMELNVIVFVPTNRMQKWCWSLEVSRWSKCPVCCLHATAGRYITFRRRPPALRHYCRSRIIHQTLWRVALRVSAASLPFVECEVGLSRTRALARTVLGRTRQCQNCYGAVGSRSRSGCWTLSVSCSRAI